MKCIIVEGKIIFTEKTSILDKAVKEGLINIFEVKKYKFKTQPIKFVAVTGRK